MPPAAAPRRLLALVVAVALVAPGVPVAVSAQEVPEAGSDGTAPPDLLPEPGIEARDVVPDVRPFLTVPGVSLRALGYGGAALDADIIERATAGLPDDPRQRVVEISGRLDEIPPQLDGLAAAEALLAGAVDRLDRQAATARRGLDVATLVVGDAEQRLSGAQARLRELSDQLDAHRRQMAEVAVAAYVRPPDADSLSRVLGGAAVSNDELTAEVLFSVKTDHDGMVRDSLEVTRAVAVERLGGARADAELATERLEEAREVLARAGARLDAHRRALSAVSAARRALADAVPALRADMERTIEQTWGALDALAAGPGVDGSAIVVVEGIRVHAAIAGQLRALLTAARADGVPLGGWGHRSIEQQIALRRAHCGPTPEDIWLKPSSACSPPTARPGASMHERGLAVDFHLGGRSISTRDSPGYRWLAEHAAAFGFFNLPSEPWHWSVNGQ